MPLTAGSEEDALAEGFDGFETFDIATTGATIRGRRGGEGPPVLLLDRDFAVGYWIWSFLAAPSPVPETLIARAPDVVVDHMLDAWSSVPDAFAPEVRSEYVAKFEDPATVHAICEEYRAAATLDYTHDEADRGRHRIACPLLALWSEDGPLASWYDDPLDLQREWADDAAGGPLLGGHFLPEESPSETSHYLLAFLTGGS